MSRNVYPTGSDSILKEGLDVSRCHCFSVHRELGKDIAAECSHSGKLYGTIEYIP